MKKRTVSDREAGSRRLALFHSRLPMTASTPITTIAPISRTILMVLCLSTQKMANSSPAMANNHSTSAMMRNVVACCLAWGVGFQSDLPA
jgi:hypothetical protein